MKKLFVILTSVMIWTAACTSPRTIADELTDASTALADDDYTRAGTICRQILQDHPMENIPVADLCDISVMLIKASEHCDTEENAAAAVRCYHYAMKAKPDSAAQCWGNMPSEDFQYVFMLNNLNTSLTATSEPADTIPEE